MFSQSSGLHSIRSYYYQYTFMIHFEIYKPWEQLKHLDFHCFIANQFKMHHRFFKMYLFLWRHFDINSVLLFKRFVQLCTFLSNRGHIFLYHTYMEKHRRQYSISNRIQCCYLFTPKYVLRVQFRVHNLDFETISYDYYTET